GAVSLLLAVHGHRRATGARFLHADAGACADCRADRRSDTGTVGPRLVPARLLQPAGTVGCAAPPIEEEQEHQRRSRQTLHATLSSTLMPSPDAPASRMHPASVRGEAGWACVVHGRAPTPEPAAAPL